MAATKYEEKSRQSKMPAFQRSTCWQPGMTGCDVHCGVLTLWSVDAGSKNISFGQISFSSSPARKPKSLTGAEANKKFFKGFKLGKHQL